MRRVGSTTLVALVVLACALAAACRRTGAGDEPAPAPTPRLTVRLGVFIPLTGDTARYGLSAANGIRMAVEESNAKGGVGGKRVELFIQDTRSDSAETDAAVRRLIGELGVHALLGEAVSSRSLVAAPIAQAARVPMLTPSATNPEVTRAGDYIFRSCYTDPFQGAALARFAADTLHARRATLLVDREHSYSTELARYIREAFAAGGGEIVAEEAYSEGADDFVEQLAAVAAARQDVIFVPGYYREAGLVARRARSMGVTAPLAGGDGWDSPSLYEIGGEALIGSYFSSHYSADDPDPLVQKFVGDYRALFGSTPDGFAATAYDGARILLDAFARAPSLEGPAVRDALAQTRDFPGVTGPVTFNAERNAVKPIVIIKIESGGRQSIQRRITPDEVAPAATPTPEPTPTPRKRPRRRARAGRR